MGILAELNEVKTTGICENWRIVVSWGDACEPDSIQ